MKHFTILFFSTFLLSGCAKQEPVSNTIADNAINATTALEQQLPAECKAESIITQITVVKTQIRAIKNACETEKAVIQHEKAKWMMAFFAMVAVIGLYVVKKVLK